MIARKAAVGAIACGVLATFFSMKYWRSDRGVPASKIVFTPPKVKAEPIPDDFAFDHPAAERARQLFLRLNVRSEEDYRALSRRERYLLDVTAFEAMLSNGGITGYMHSGDGDHYEECLEALKDIGATDSYQCLSSTCKFFPNERPSKDTDKRRQELDEVIKKVGDFEAAVPGGPEYELYQLMLNYWDKHD